MDSNQARINISGSTFDDMEEMEKFEINPLFYAHMVISQIIRSPNLAFINGAKEAGIFCLAIGVDQLEKVCMANDMIDKADYERFISDQEKHLGTEKDSMVIQYKKANIKFQYLLQKVFKKKVVKADVVL